MSIALALLLIQIPQPMPVAALPPADSEMWPEFLLAPPLRDRDRFPCQSDVRLARDFNYRHRLWLAGQLEYESDPYRQSILANWDREAHALYRVWDLLDDARHDCYPAWRQRVALKRLREAIGDEAYSAGRMPPCVPVWRFREMKP